MHSAQTRRQPSFVLGHHIQVRKNRDRVLHSRNGNYNLGAINPLPIRYSLLRNPVPSGKKVVAIEAVFLCGNYSLIQVDLTKLMSEELIETPVLLPTALLHQKVVWPDNTFSVQIHGCVASNHTEQWVSPAAVWPVQVCSVPVCRVSIIMARFFMPTGKPLQALPA